MKVKLLNGNILTELQNEDKEGGLIMPKAYKTLKVIKSDSEEVKSGSTIYVIKTAGTDVKIEDNKYVVVNIREIILIL